MHLPVDPVSIGNVNPGEVNHRKDRSSKVNTETLGESDGERNKVTLNFKRPNREKLPNGRLTVKSLYQNNCPKQLPNAHGIQDLLKLDIACLATLFHLPLTTQTH